MDSVTQCNVEKIDNGAKMSMEWGQILVPQDTDQDEASSHYIGYPCNSCDSRYKTKDNLRRHVKTKHEGLVQSKHDHIYHFCNQCDYSANVKSNLNKHILNKHEGIQYFCELCSYAANQKGQLKTHVNSIHKSIYFYCNKCDFKTGHQRYLRVHIESKHDNVTYTCNFCGCKVSRKSILKRHMEVKHSFKVRNYLDFQSKSSTAGNIEPKTEQYSHPSPEKFMQINLGPDKNVDNDITGKVNLNNPDKDSKDNLTDIVIKKEILDNPPQVIKFKKYFKEEGKDKTIITNSEDKDNFDEGKEEESFVYDISDKIRKDKLTDVVIKEEMLDDLVGNNAISTCIKDVDNKSKGEEDLNLDILGKNTEDSSTEKEKREEDLDLELIDKTVENNLTDSKGEEHSDLVIPYKTARNNLRNTIIKEEKIDDSLCDKKSREGTADDHNSKLTKRQDKKKIKRIKGKRKRRDFGIADKITEDKLTEDRLNLDDKGQKYLNVPDKNINMIESDIVIKEQILDKSPDIGNFKGKIDNRSLKRKSKGKKKIQTRRKEKLTLDNTEQKSEDNLKEDGYNIDDKNEETNLNYIKTENSTHDLDTIINVENDEHLSEEKEDISPTLTNICPLCNKSFSRVYDLKVHLQIHTGVKQFSCHYCPKTFSRNFNLTLHLKTHTGEKGEKEVSCPECSKKFTRREHLPDHMKIHTGEKPYFCDRCSMSFRQISNMKRHLRTHSNEKPYLCTECPKSFSQNVNLRVHMRIHKGEKPYMCSQCPKTFAQSSNLKSHMSKH